MRLKEVKDIMTNSKKPLKDITSTNGKSKMVLINNKIVWRGITYDPGYPAMLIKHCDKPLYRKVKNNVSGIVQKVPTDYPTFESFRIKHKIPVSTWNSWLAKYPELAEARDIVNDMKSRALKVNGLNGSYSAPVVKMVGMNDLGWTEKSENTNRTADLTEEQKQKMFDEYMKDLKDGEVIVLDTKKEDEHSKEI